MLGYEVELLATLERRLELLAELGVEETLVVEFTPEVAALAPEEFAAPYLAAIGAELVVAGEDFRFGRGRRGDLALLERLGFDGASSPARRGRLLDRDPRGSSAPARSAAAAALLGRPVEVEGSSSRATRAAARSASRPRTSRADPACSCPRFGIYAGAARGHRAAVSIGVNPHYGGAERRIEAFLLDFEGDLYGRRLVVELWERLRDEAVFAERGRAGRADRARRRGDARPATRLTPLPARGASGFFSSYSP